MAQRVLSIFIDESGDFGAYEKHAPYYIVSMIFHDQAVDLYEKFKILDSHIIANGFPLHALHIGPIIRREAFYANEKIEQRRRLFNALFNFVRRADINYISTFIRKTECVDEVDMTAKLSRAITKSLKEHYEYLSSFDKIILYYDNGQIELTKILTSVFSALFNDVEFRRVKPLDYKLFQAADLICTLELINLKISSSGMSHSEEEFFESARNFKKSYFRYIQKKRLS